MKTAKLKNCNRIAIALVDNIALVVYGRTICFKAILISQAELKKTYDDLNF